MKTPTVALIIARSEKLLESLLVLLRAIPRIGTIHQAQDGPSALGMGLEVQPALVLLDCDLSVDRLRTTMSQLRAAWPQARYVVFIDEGQQCQSARDTGADSVLVKGVRAAEILRTIEDLMHQHH